MAIGIPLMLICCGAFAKKLVRGPDWERADFYLGVELTLASLTSAFVYVFDLVQIANEKPFETVYYKMLATASFLVVCFFLLLIVLTIHQDWTKRNLNQMGQFVWLVIVANLIGAGLLAAFVLLVKGVK